MECVGSPCSCSSGSTSLDDEPLRRCLWRLLLVVSEGEEREAGVLKLTLSRSSLGFPIMPRSVRSLLIGCTNLDGSFYG